MKAIHKIHFTEKALTELEPDPVKRVFYYDSNTDNLSLAVNPKGTKTFFLYRWIDRRPERIKIGRFPNMSLAKAKRELKILQGRIEQGDNPAQSKRDFREEPTLRDFFEVSYLERHAKIKKKSWKQDVTLFNSYLYRIADRRLSEVDDSRVYRLHRKIGSQNGKFVANRAIMLLSVIYNKALKWKQFAGDNPASNIELYDEPSRERFLSKDEARILVAAAEEEQNEHFIDFISLCLLTGVRSGNLYGMRWIDIDDNFERWIIPREHTKNKKPHCVQLTEPAAEILRRRRFRDRGNSEYVLHESTPEKCSRRFRYLFTKTLRRSGIDHCRIHDLRHTVASWLINGGASLPVAQEILGHINFRSTMRYIHIAKSPARDILEQTTAGFLEKDEDEGQQEQAS